jgi:hypothetical protein
MKTTFHTLDFAPFDVQGIIRRVKRGGEGNRDPSSPWSKARLRWVTQLSVRLGLYNFDEAAAGNKVLGLTGIPACFNPE